MSWFVTGAGAVTSVGKDADETFANLCAGRSGLAELRAFDSAQYRTQHAYEIDDRPARERDVPYRATDWLLRSVTEAAEQAGLGTDLSGIPVLVGTGLRELRSAELAWRDGADFDISRLHFGTALRERFGTSDSHTFSNACSASLYALALATDMLASGMHETVVVAGVDTLTESMYGSLDRVHMEPPRSVQPFDRQRRGVLMGEGAAAVVLRRDVEDRSSSLGTVRSVSVNCDAHHVTAPDPRGITEAVRAAHDLAGVKPSDIDLVLLHGTGTLLNDEGEATAVSQAFGPDVGVPLMTAVKSMTGHTSGGSGLLSLIVALRSLATGWVPPIAGLRRPVAEADGFRFVQKEARRVSDMSLAQVDAFGFGGVNAVAVVERGAR
ncbi:3-oxoacyl-ACP synthase [Streptomyces abyssalis]|uniref:3-oxoacyl-ACP synthase n=1 Tax=Streptomyces abyssalis TaxID=933944 RepID=A0A1E7JMT9_9ACTN|nr:beta-ketoacyl synthase N-terminal-like domain-containing protein [Streptomyces abyssalis]OEU87016.1 3-oxoacyl-ACP synthase [Streptomyces abyssalis]OEU89599.1 3-oxoacyl-ACP synthase [Streptomyces abyssalis]OEV21080.1 3-oxoacyl-ACP synthase [Streptomyces nanshensis]